MITKYQDISLKSEEGKLLLIAIGTIAAYAKKINKPFKDYDDIIRQLKEDEISIDTDLIFNSN